MPLSKDALLRAYRTMKTIRLFEEQVFKEFQGGNIPGFVHVYDGQEAVATGICMHLNDDDYIGSTHRGHGHCIAKGCDVKGMMLEIMAKADGLCRGKGGSMHIADISKGMLGANAIVGGAPPLCVGAALSSKTLRRDNVAVAFTGDGGANQGTVFESMNLAVVLQVPVIFVFENNGYAEGTSASYAVGSGDIAKRAKAFGMPAVKVDGIDFFAVHDAMAKAVAHCKQGKGPYAIEAEVVRFNGHFVGDPQLYRGDGEIEHLRAEKDCLKQFRRQVTEKRLLKKAELDAVDGEVQALIDAAVAEALAAPQPSPDELTTDVYASY